MELSLTGKSLGRSREEKKGLSWWCRSGIQMNVHLWTHDLSLPMASNLITDMFYQETIVILCFSKSLGIVFFYVLGCFACTYVYTSNACSHHEGQKRTLSSLDLELQMVVNCLVGGGNWTWVSEELPIFLTCLPFLQSFFFCFDCRILCFIM